VNPRGAPAPGAAPCAPVHRRYRETRPPRRAGTGRPPCPPPPGKRGVTSHHPKGHTRINQARHRRPPLVPPAPPSPYLDRAGPPGCTFIPPERRLGSNNAEGSSPNVDAKPRRGHRRHRSAGRAAAAGPPVSARERPLPLRPVRWSTPTTNGDHNSHLLQKTASFPRRRLRSSGKSVACRREALAAGPISCTPSGPGGVRRPPPLTRRTVTFFTDELTARSAYIRGAGWIHPASPANPRRHPRLAARAAVVFSPGDPRLPRPATPFVSWPLAGSCASRAPWGAFAVAGRGHVVPGHVR